jgi:hypothetical protein
MVNDIPAGSPQIIPRIYGRYRENTPSIDHG